MQIVKCIRAMKLYYTTLLCVLFIFTQKLSAQETINKESYYKVISNNSKEVNNFYISALAKANMENFRLKNEDVQIKFKEGVVCVLLSASKIKNTGITIELNSYKDQFDDNFILPVFSVTPDGYLLTEYKKKLK